MNVREEFRRRVLIVEDNPHDVMLIKMALDHAGLDCLTDVAEDGEAALDLFFLNAADQDEKGYDLILLDLNIPKKDGIEVLQTIRRDILFGDTLVFILSSSPGDVIERMIRTANSEANCYLTKPPDLDEFLALGNVIRDCLFSSELTRSSRVSGTER